MTGRGAVLWAARRHHLHLQRAQSLTKAISLTTPTTSASSTQCLRRYATATQSHSQSVKRSRTIPIFITTAILGGAIYYFSSSSKPSLLNTESFIPYKITSREAISPTSFVFTISPHLQNPSLPYLTPSTSSWRYPLWSVEFKQPEVQIARHYTPLPPQEGDDPSDGSLRFYVRAIGGGEMSTYLSRLGVGRDVWLRGPHVGFDVPARLGGMKNVVFLAGGTGVVPAMQVAKAVLEQGPEAQVNILWAIRKRDELQSQHADNPVRQQSSWWQFWRANSDKPVEIHSELQDPSPIARQLKAMTATYGERLHIQVAIDEEQTQFRESDLQKAVSLARRPDLSLTRSISAPGCRLHDASMLEMAPEFETPAAPDDCKCGTGAGKNLFMISGPDGFIAHYAGSKRWLGGQQVQGPVGGVAAQLWRRYPWLADEWLVLKL
ncbi:cytochrome-c mitochondrial import factor cyc2 [Trichoderma arundinaceum]|uniref:Cytochrome-c mitochondrial import factor cyc2 n=1 Tax=Trichoderma arundinaceum TaxID=490622 RepID=A0A395NZT3_TRIAR|nr:cytochrome-c mitochondrial import factor cyc2 [Trichoderma arundinaceum]